MKDNVKQLRVYLDQVLTYLKTNVKPSREVSLTITSVQMSRMMLGKLLGELGDDYPYPDSVKPENRNVEAAADVNKDNTWLADWVRDEMPADADQLIKIKALRKLFTEFLSVRVDQIHIEATRTVGIDEKMETAGWKAAYSYEAALELKKANMWLGCELELEAKYPSGQPRK